MENNTDIILKGLRAFLTACPDGYDFPIGGELGIPAAFENDFLAILGSDMTAPLLERIRQSIKRDEAYSLAIFAVRMAIYGARLSDSAPIEKSLWILSVDDNEVDWRDTLVCLAIIEDCSAQIGFDFSGKITEFAQLAPSRRKNTIIEGYLFRTPDMRNVEALGYKPMNPGGCELTYVRDY